MIVTIHQPDFAPWLGFFDRWAASDLYVVLDDVQFIRRGWHHRDKIKTAHGVQWLTVPVKKKGRYGQSINETEIDNGTNWRDKHLKTIAAAYGDAPRFAHFFPLLEQVYARGHELLVDLNMELLRLFAGELGVSTPLVMASSRPTAARKSERILDLVLGFGGSSYMSGFGSREYLEERLFKNNGIRVLWREFEHPEYPQRYGAFVKGLSAMDYLMNTDASAWRKNNAHRC